MIEWIAIIVLGCALILVLAWLLDIKQELDHVHNRQNKDNSSIELACVQELYLPKIWDRLKKLEAITINLNDILQRANLRLDVLETYKRFATKTMVDYIQNDAEADANRDNTLKAHTQELDRAFTMIKALQNETPKAKKLKSK